jgi:Leucine-rich repeat (LRR) protein
VQFLAVIEIEPMNPRGYTGAAQAYVGLGLMDEAVAVLEQGLERLPEEVSIIEALEELAAERQAQDAYVVEWADPAFERLVRQALAKPEGDIWQSDLDFVTDMDIWGNTHIWINGESGDVEYEDVEIEAYDASTYSVDGVLYERGSIESLADTAHFRKLTSLAFCYNQVSDLIPLSGLTDLTWLYMGGNQINDITPLSLLTNLTSLHLDYNQISNISPISALKNLTHVVLYNNRITDLSPLSGLTNLTHLNLMFNQIINIAPLSELTNLTSLNLMFNQIISIAPLSELTNLTSLTLQSNQISNLTPLSSLTNLTVLNLGDNKISDLTPLSRLTKLTTLWLFENQISDLSPLSGLTNLTEFLGLTNNPITDWSPVAHLPKVNGRE